MTAVDFYTDLSNASEHTIEIGGGVLVYKNGDKWHLCRKGVSKVVHACSNGSPPNPNDSYWDSSVAATRFNKSAKTVKPLDALEIGRMCTFCERILKREFDIEVMTVAFKSDNDKDEAVERFKKKFDAYNK